MTIGTKAFAIGFFIGLFLFIAINVYSYSQMREEECFDCIKNFGFPFRFYESGSILHMERILWFRLVADVLIAICMSIGTGLVCHLAKNRSVKATQ